MNQRSVIVKSLLAAFSVVMLAFLVASGAFVRATDELDRDTGVITKNAYPSIEHLAASRVSAVQVHERLSREVNHCHAGQPIDLAPARQAQADLQRQAAGYQRLPTFVGEPELQGRILAALANLDDLIGQLERLLLSGRCGQAEALLDDRLAPTIDRASDLLISGIEINVRHASEASQSIFVARSKARHLAVLMNVVAVLVALVAATALITLLRRKQAAQEQRASELEQFAARVAHDIRNPLAAIHLSLDMAARRADPKPAIERARHSVQRVEEIVRALYDFARARLVPDPGARVDAAEVVRDVIEGCRDAATDVRLALRSDVKPGTMLAAPAGAVISIVENLVRNAIRHTAGQATRVEVSASVAGEQVEIEVRDDGPGINPELRRRLFRPQVQRRPSGGDGLGLGLATVQRLTEALGGDCGVRAAPGHGAEFWVRLPSGAL